MFVYPFQSQDLVHGMHPTATTLSFMENRDDLLGCTLCFIPNRKLVDDPKPITIRLSTSDLSGDVSVAKSGDSKISAQSVESGEAGKYTGQIVAAFPRGLGSSEFLCRCHYIFAHH